MKLSIIGLGFVGEAMEKAFKNKGVKEICSYDKFKDGGIGTLEDCLETDIMFLALPTPYNEHTKKYWLEPIEETLEKVSSKNYKGLIVIKSTVEPGTTERLNKYYSNLNLCHNPEFLSARTAYHDFLNQKHIVLGKSSLCDNDKFQLVRNFYSSYWCDARVSLSTSNESEMMKLSCNCFYAVKIQFFNELYLTCQSQDMDYNKVKNMMLYNEWINPMHTNVPGPDGKLSYGGLCFPKDTNALATHMERNNVPNAVLKGTIKERNIMREDNDNCLNMDN
jgi:UDPglucose 6-dehydrogenase